MSVKVDQQSGFGKKNENNLITVRAVDGPSPMSVTVINDGTASAVISFAKKIAGTQVFSDKDTAVSGESTGYTGNASTLEFSGQTLDHLPVIPKTVNVTPTAGGNTVDAVDTNGDGILYTDDNDADECGTIDYITGALYLNYPSGKDPNTGAITCDYRYQDNVLAANGGRKVFEVAGIGETEKLNVYAAGQSPTEGTEVRVITVTID